ncbi:MAG: hypothetical protein P4L22_04850 [Candidatus Babeliales bacterium]|nr:hypothetical protein [Candidatus Babeliales bacterium]
MINKSKFVIIAFLVATSLNIFAADENNSIKITNKNCDIIKSCLAQIKYLILEIRFSPSDKNFVILNYNKIRKALSLDMIFEYRDVSPEFLTDVTMQLNSFEDNKQTQPGLNQDDSEEEQPGMEEEKNSDKSCNCVIQ